MTLRGSSHPPTTCLFSQVSSFLNVAGTLYRLCSLSEPHTLHMTDWYGYYKLLYPK